MKTTERILDSGYEIKCRLVPPYATGDVIASIPRPVYPTVDLLSADGHTEHAMALEDTPEWAKWQAENRQYNAKCAKEIGKHLLTYGIVAYREQGSDQEWQSKPPDNWQVPVAMARYGIEATDDQYERWLQFIKYELIVSERDEAVVNDATSAKPLTPTEVDAAIIPFGSKSK